MMSFGLLKIIKKNTTKSNPLINSPMRTALSEILDWLNEIDNSVFALSAPENELKMLSQFKDKCKSLLEKEKKQIIDAYNKGCTIKTDVNNGETYYTNTFNQ